MLQNCFHLVPACAITVTINNNNDYYCPRINYNTEIKYKIERNMFDKEETSSTKLMNNTNSKYVD